MAINWTVSRSDWGEIATANIGGFFLVAGMAFSKYFWAVMHKEKTLVSGVADDWSKCLQYPQQAVAILAKASRAKQEAGKENSVLLGPIRELGKSINGHLPVRHACQNTFCFCGKAEGQAVYAG